ncbi:hypothetical protein [Saccharopolyspora cebuensis]|uniref:Uncharacterized protein n=1 Tax=Saccharopolyspora cebuensis TaxID=418759 RepID=A0ABV4CAC9_9PSEU
MGSFADVLLSGPRGRRLCWCAAGGRLDPGAADAVLHRDVEVSDLLVAFADSVACAMYWQEPDDVDLALAAPEAVRELRPAAEAVAAASGTGWWFEPIGADQRYVRWVDPVVPAPELTGAADRLARWRAATVELEAACRARDVALDAPVSGTWWSTPNRMEIVTTTRPLPGLGAAGLGAVGLVLDEDSLGVPEAICHPLRPARESRDHEIRIHEIRGAADWCALVERYPLEVTASRRHDWWRATGTDARWLIPDYAAVAADHDAVHLTAAAYLEAAGRALPVGDAATVLAGWNADETWWLTDVLGPAGAPERWCEDEDDPVGWAHTS